MDNKENEEERCKLSTKEVSHQQRRITAVVAKRRICADDAVNARLQQEESGTLSISISISTSSPKTNGVYHRGIEGVLKGCQWDIGGVSNGCQRHIKGARMYLVRARKVEAVIGVSVAATPLDVAHHVEDAGGRVPVHTQPLT